MRNYEATQYSQPYNQLEHLCSLQFPVSILAEWTSFTPEEIQAARERLQGKPHQIFSVTGDSQISTARTVSFPSDECDGAKTTEVSTAPGDPLATIKNFKPQQVFVRNNNVDSLTDPEECFNLACFHEQNAFASDELVNKNEELWQARTLCDRALRLEERNRKQQ